MSATSEGELAFASLVVESVSAVSLGGGLRDVRSAIGATAARHNRRQRKKSARRRWLRRPSVRAIRLPSYDLDQRMGGSVIDASGPDCRWHLPRACIVRLPSLRGGRVPLTTGSGNGAGAPWADGRSLNGAARE